MNDIVNKGNEWERLWLAVATKDGRTAIKSLMEYQVKAVGQRECIDGVLGELGIEELQTKIVAIHQLCSCTFTNHKSQSHIIAMKHSIFNNYTFRSLQLLSSLRVFTRLHQDFNLTSSLKANELIILIDKTFEFERYSFA